MSAGAHHAGVQSDVQLLAPKMREAVDAWVADCEAAGEPVRIFETQRSPELAAIYYARGRTVKPPEQPVTHARTNLESWHGFALALDFIHPEHGWNPPDGLAWFERAAERAERHGLAWGGRWPGRKCDPPHLQWGRCRDSPSDRARELLAQGGLEAVWREVGAA